MRTINKSGAIFVLATILAAAALATPAPNPASPQKKEYLSDAEADKIREAGATGPRIVLYTTFASDRIKKLQYEFAHLDPKDDKRTERFNILINGYTGCIDDAADSLDVGIEKQEDIRDGVKLLQAQIKGFLSYLQELAEKGPEKETYKDNLDDAIDATNDAIRTADDAIKDLAPPPVRRKPS